MSVVEHVEKCYYCDLSCNGVDSEDECIPEWCLTQNIMTIALFVFLGSWLTSQLIRFYQNAPSRLTWSVMFTNSIYLKTIVFVSGTSFCIMRILRFALLFVNIQTHGRVGLVVDQVLYWNTFTAIMVMYASLLMMWVKLCEYGNLMASWLQGKTKILLIIENIFVFILMTAIGVTTALGDGRYVSVLNYILAPPVLISCIAYIVEGWKVHKLLYGSEMIKLRQGGHKWNQINSTTTFAILASGGCVLILISIGVFTTLRQGPLKNFWGCMTVHAIYRGGEAIALLLICFHFRTIKSGSGQTTAESNRSHESSNHLSMNDLQDQ